MTSASSTAPPAALSGKTDRDESFPVAWLLPARLRGPVLAFYAFARTADDIADSPGLTREEKLVRLAALEQAGLPHPSAAPLLEAFRRDAGNPACGTWDHLMDYCRLSAMPVGRFLLDVCGEAPLSANAARASDSLCAALQVLNHVQGCGEDWRLLGRQYIPTAWLADAGLSPSALAERRCSPALRRVLDRVLGGVDTLLDEAAPLPGLIRHRRLRMQAAATLSLAHALRGRLAVHDPLAAKIRPSRLDWATALGRALTAGVAP